MVDKLSLDPQAASSYPETVRELEERVDAVFRAPPFLTQVAQAESEPTDGRPLDNIHKSAKGLLAVLRKADGERAEVARGAFGLLLREMERNIVDTRNEETGHYLQVCLDVLGLVLGYYFVNGYMAAAASAINKHYFGVTRVIHHTTPISTLRGFFDTQLKLRYAYGQLPESRRRDLRLDERENSVLARLRTTSDCKLVGLVDDEALDPLQELAVLLGNPQPTKLPPLKAVGGVSYGSDEGDPWEVTKPRVSQALPSTIPKMLVADVVDPIPPLKWAEDEVTANVGDTEGDVVDASEHSPTLPRAISEDELPSLGVQPESSGSVSPVAVESPAHGSADVALIRRPRFGLIGAGVLGLLGLLGVSIAVIVGSRGQTGESPRQPTGQGVRASAALVQSPPASAESAEPPSVEPEPEPPVDIPVLAVVTLRTDSAGLRSLVSKLPRQWRKEFLEKAGHVSIRIAADSSPLQQRIALIRSYLEKLKSIQFSAAVHGKNRDAFVAVLEREFRETVYKDPELQPRNKQARLFFRAVEPVPTPSD